MTEEEHKRKRLDAQLEILGSLVSQEAGLLPIIGSVSAALIAVLTFGDKIVFSSLEFRVLLTIFLSITLICFIYAYYVINRGKATSQRIINSILEKDIFSKFNKSVSRFDKTLSFFPWIVLTILSILTFYIICVIWRV